jgi:chaperonin GroES
MKRPLGDRVLVRRKKAEDTTQGGIIIPGSAQTELNEGVVLAVGGGYYDKQGNWNDLEVQEGEVVEFSKFGGVKVSISDYSPDGKKEELLVLKESEILLRNV